MRSRSKLPALPQASYVTLSKPLTLSEFQDPHAPIKEARAFVFISSDVSKPGVFKGLWEAILFPTSLCKMK